MNGIKHRKSTASSSYQRIGWESRSDNQKRAEEDGRRSRNKDVRILGTLSYHSTYENRRIASTDVDVKDTEIQAWFASSWEGESGATAARESAGKSQFSCARTDVLCRRHSLGNELCSSCTEVATRDFAALPGSSKLHSYPNRWTRVEATYWSHSGTAARGECHDDITQTARGCCSTWESCSTCEIRYRRSGDGEISTRSICHRMTLQSSMMYRVQRQVKLSFRNFADRQDSCDRSLY